MDKDTLLRDASVFSDPATEPSISEGLSTIDVLMTRNGDKIRFSVDRQSGQVSVHAANSQRFSSFSSLLASSLFADIRRLSATQRNIFANFDDSKYIEAEGTITRDGNPISSKLNCLSLDELLSPGDFSSKCVRVVLLDGQAGVGKTSLIRRILVRRARHVNSTPIIHVESRGGRLYGLNQLLAASLDSLRAAFTFDQVPALIRHGLLHVAIDGFDELVDSEGYADAWAALSDFISEIGGSGSIILAGRDTFFDQQAFGERLSDTRQRINLIGARLSPISNNNAREYLKLSGWSPDELSKQEASDILTDGSYALRPFFLRVIAEAPVKSWETLARNETLRNTLVWQFLAREASIIREKTSLQQNTAEEHLYRVFCEIAAEMASTESDAVDTSFIELLIETIFGDVIGSTELGRLTYKAGSIALLEQDARRGFRRFPHTELSNYFLAHAIMTSEWSSSARRLLARANMGGDLLGIFSEEFAQIDDEKAKRFISMIERAMATEKSSGGQLDANLGSLWVATLSRPIEGMERVLKDYELNEVALTGICAEGILKNIIVNRMDVRGADLRQISFINTTVSTLVVDNETTLGEPPTYINHVQVTDNISVRSLRGADADQWVKEHAIYVDKQSQSGAEDLLWKVAFTLTKRYGIRDSDSDPAGRLLRNPIWPEIERILAKTGRVERTPNRGAGPRDEFLRIHNPIGLLRKEGAVAEAIWREVRALD